METPQPEPIVISPQHPTVRLFIVCADAVLQVPQTDDLQYAFWEIHNPYHTVWMPPGVKKNFVMHKLCVYAQLTDGLGTFNFGLKVEQVDLVNPKRNKVMGLVGPIQVTFDNPWDVIEEVVQFNNIPFPRPGQYLFSLIENGKELPGGSTYLRVMPGENT